MKQRENKLNIRCGVMPRKKVVSLYGTVVIINKRSSFIM